MAPCTRARRKRERDEAQPEAERVAQKRRVKAVSDEASISSASTVTLVTPKPKAVLTVSHRPAPRRSPRFITPLKKTPQPKQVPSDVENIFAVEGGKGSPHAYHLQAYGEDYLQHLRDVETMETSRIFGSEALGPHTLCVADEPDEGGNAFHWNDEPNARVDFFFSQVAISSHMRAILVRWLWEVRNEYKISNAAGHLAVSLLDELLEQDTLTLERHTFQCTGCICMWMAAKLLDEKTPSVADFCYIADHSFTAEAFLQHERDICQALNYSFHRITPWSFYEILSKCLTQRQQRDCSVWLDRARTGVWGRPSSLVVAACLHLSGVEWTATVQHYSDYELSQVYDTALRIWRVQHWQPDDETVVSPRIEDVVPGLEWSHEECCVSAVVQLAARDQMP